MIIIVNRETGEEKTLHPDKDGKYPTIKLPWLPQGTTLRSRSRLQEIMQEGRVLKDAMALAFTSKMYHSVVDFIRAAATLFGIEHCSKCDMRMKVAKSVYKLGIAKTNELLLRSIGLKEDSEEFKQLQAEVQELLNVANDNQHTA